jgi:hypothetical protein
MRFEFVINRRLRNIAPRHLVIRHESSQADAKNNSVRQMSCGERVKPPIAQRSLMSDEELGAQAWLDEQLVKFYRTRNGRWPKLRQLFARVVGGWLFPSRRNESRRGAADHGARPTSVGAPVKRQPGLQIRERAVAAIDVIGRNAATSTAALEIVQFYRRTVA